MSALGATAFALLFWGNVAVVAGVFAWVGWQVLEGIRESEWGSGPDGG